MTPPYTIRVVEGDLLDQEVDVIVNAWNCHHDLLVRWLRIMIPLTANRKPLLENDLDKQRSVGCTYSCTSHDHELHS